MSQDGGEGRRRWRAKGQPDPVASGPFPAMTLLASDGTTRCGTPAAVPVHGQREVRDSGKGGREKREEAVREDGVLAVPLVGRRWNELLAIPAGDPLMIEQRRLWSARAMGRGTVEAVDCARLLGRIPS